MPNNWKTYKLTELVENIVDNRGKTCPTDVSGIPLIATNCIRNEKLYPDFTNLRYVSDETYNNWFRAHPKPDDMLFVLKGTPGRVCWTPNPINFCVAQDMVALRAKKDIIYPKYLFALLRSKIAQDKINALHVGSLIPHFKKTDFDKLELPVFEDINYQKEIGNIYFDICDKIENNLAINKTLEEMAMALYKHWFVDFGPFQDGEFVESELGKIPNGWEVKRLVEFVNLTMGQSPKSEFYNLNNEGLPFHQGVTNYGERFPEDKTYSTEGNRFAEEGDILFSVRAPVGRLNIAKNKIILGRGLSSMTLKNHDNNGFLFYSLKNFFTEDDKIGDGTVYGSVNKTELENLKFIVPCKEVLDNFNDLVKDIDSKYLNNYRENQTLTQLRDTLLPKLISGEVRLKEFVSSDK